MEFSGQYRKSPPLVGSHAWRCSPIPYASPTRNHGERRAIGGKLPRTGPDEDAARGRLDVRQNYGDAALEAPSDVRSKRISSRMPAIATRTCDATAPAVRSVS